MSAMEFEEPSFTPELFAFLRSWPTTTARGSRPTSPATTPRSGNQRSRSSRTSAYRSTRSARTSWPTPAGRRVAVPDPPRHALLEGQDAVQDAGRPPVPPRARKAPTRPATTCTSSRGNVFVGCGAFHPDRARCAPSERHRGRPAPGGAIVERAAFAERFRLDGESLKRAPAASTRDHPLIDDLKRKDFIAVAALRQGDVARAGFLEQSSSCCADASAFVRFLCAAARVAF